MIEQWITGEKPLPSVNAMRVDDDQRGSQFSQAIAQEKHERIARNYLYDLFIFHDELEKEIARYGEIPGKLTAIETEILERMLTTQEYYHAAMNGFKELSAEMQQHALVRFSDALLDLMKVMHKHRRH